MQTVIKSKHTNEVLQLKDFPKDSQLIIYSDFLQQGNYDTFNGFLKQLGNAYFDIHTLELVEY